MEELRYCEYCGNEFVVRNASIKKRFCSYKCSNAWKWENVRERQKYLQTFCGNCGKEISIPTNDHRIKEGQKVFFCNKDCAFEYIRKNPKTNNCIVCGKSFKKDRRKKCCSRECANTHRRYLAFKRFYRQDIGLQEFMRLCECGNPFVYSGRESEYLKSYNEINRDRINKQKRDRELSDGVLRFANRIKKNIQQAYRRGNNLGEYMSSVLGCSISEFVSHIESLFKDGMSRDNYGEWELDHIVPISSAKSKDEVVTLCHYSNYQPLWRNENKKKGKRL